MRHRLFIPAATALLLGLAACTQDELADDNRLPEGEYPVVIRATGLSVEATPQAAPSTRATVDGDWQGVQTVALKMGDAVKEYTVTATDADGYKSATLSRTDDTHYWTSRDPITVSAWWPIDKADITRMPAVKVAEDQSKLADFQNSDFISAENQTVKFDDPKLTFTHRTARVAIELKPGTGFTSVDGATVSLVSLSTDNGNPTAIQTYHASGNSYEALTAPQTVAKGEPFIRVELGGGNFYFRPQNDVVLEAGNRYTYTVKVNATGLTLAGCEIGKWDDGGGESGAAEDLGYNYDTNTKTYTVYNADGLLAWNEAAQKDESINCTLSADINMAGKGWTPIGTDENNSYNGTFDGNGKTITGLTVNQSEKNYAGLFGCLGSDGKVQNLTLENVHISGVFYVGSVVGTNFGTVSGCTASGNITGTESCIGGVVGQNRGTVTGCTVSGNISSNQYTGGVVGENFGTVSACYHATGDVTGNINYVGGVVGWNYYGTVTACYHVNGNVTATYNWVGSVAGFNNGVGSVTACYWNDSPDPGIGYDNGSGQATKVDGTDVTWADAVDAMNSALQNAGSEWRYELTGELPTLKKEE
ncbi:fimbrillin family protein [Phocaeicola coprophilus]|nr:fimbrillin family protein [Phocaeicola coprophilus]